MRQLILSKFPDVGGAVTLYDREYRHLIQVLRKTVGNSVDARLPDGMLCPLRVSSVNRKEKSVTLLLSAPAIADVPNNCLAPVAVSRQKSNSETMPAISGVPESFPSIILFQWILKGPRMDQVIRQATETGGSLIVPVAGERCLSPSADAIGEGKLVRWKRIVREALQQCGSPVPTVLAPVDIDGLAEVWRSVGGTQSIALVLTEAPLARRSLHEYLCTGTGPTALAVGPEGGMTVREIALLEGTGFVCVHFKTNILREETAALYGIAAIQSALLESENWRLRESNF